MSRRKEGCQQFKFTDFADYPGTIFRSYGAGTDYSNHFIMKDDAKSIGSNSPQLAAIEKITHSF